MMMLLLKLMDAAAVMVVTMIVCVMLRDLQMVHQTTMQLIQKEIQQQPPPPTLNITQYQNETTSPYEWNKTNSLPTINSFNTPPQYTQISHLFKPNCTHVMQQTEDT
jgi:hypothetical protein